MPYVEYDCVFEPRSVVPQEIPKGWEWLCHVDGLLSMEDFNRFNEILIDKLEKKGYDFEGVTYFTPKEYVDDYEVVFTVHKYTKPTPSDGVRVRSLIRETLRELGYIPVKRR